MKSHLTQQQLNLLRSAFLPGSNGLEAWRQFNANTNWNGHIDFTSMSLVPYALRRLKEHGYVEPRARRLRAISRRALLANSRWLELMKSDLPTSIADPGLIALLPPAALVAHHHGEVIDTTLPPRLLVPAAEAAKVLRSFLSHDFCGIPDIPNWTISGFAAGARHYHLQHPNGRAYELIWGFDGRLFDDEASIWKRMQLLHAASTDMKVLDVTDAALMELRTPLCENAFARLALLLKLLSAPELNQQKLRRDCTTHGVESSWRALLAEAAEFLPHLRLADCPDVAPELTPPPRGLIARIQVGWRVFNTNLASQNHQGLRLTQLPGYLLGRWQLRSVLQIAPGLVSWWRARHPPKPIQALTN